MRGLALEGGGAKGAFHVGALQAFFDRGITFDAVTGTSIGALNGAMIAQGDFETLKMLWTNAAISKVADVDDAEFDKLMSRDYDRSLVKYLVKKAREVISSRGMPIDKLKSIVDKYIDEDKLRTSKIDYGLVTVAVSNGWEPMELFKEDVPEGLLKDYILASAYYPLYNRPEIGGKRFLDGGIYNNCPISPLVRKGYSDIVAIRTGSRMPMRGVIDRSVKITYVIPSESLGGTVDLRKPHVEYNMKLGYFDALRALDKLGGFRYYIEPMEVAEAMSFILNLRESAFSDLSDVLREKGPRNTIFAHAFAVAHAELDLPDKFGAVETMTAILEEAARIHGVEKFKIYTLNDFLKEIKSRLDTPPSGSVTKSYEMAVAVLRHIDV